MKKLIYRVFKRNKATIFYFSFVSSIILAVFTLLISISNNITPIMSEMIIGEVNVKVINTPVNELLNLNYKEAKVTSSYSIYVDDSFVSYKNVNINSNKQKGFISSKYHNIGDTVNVLINDCNYKLICNDQCKDFIEISIYDLEEQALDFNLKYECDEFKKDIKELKKMNIKDDKSGISIFNVYNFLIIIEVSFIIISILFMLFFIILSFLFIKGLVLKENYNIKLYKIIGLSDKKICLLYFPLYIIIELIRIVVLSLVYFVSILVINKSLKYDDLLIEMGIPIIPLLAFVLTEIAAVFYFYFLINRLPLNLKEVD